MLATFSAQEGQGCEIRPSFLLGLRFFSIFDRFGLHGPMGYPPLASILVDVCIDFLAILAPSWLCARADAGWAGGVARSVKNFDAESDF